MSTNNLQTVGNLTADPILGFSAAGKAYARFSIAVNTGKDQPAVFWNCTTFGEMAEHLAQSTQRGDRISIDGRIEADNYTAEDGSERKGLRVLVDEVGVSLRFSTVEVNRTKREPANA